MRVRKIERMQYWVHPIYSCYNFMLISAFLSAYFYFARNAIHMIQYKIEFPETINRTLRRICAKRIFVGRQWAINRLGIGREKRLLWKELRRHLLIIISFLWLSLMHLEQAKGENEDACSWWSISRTIDLYDCLWAVKYAYAPICESNELKRDKDMHQDY